MKSYLLPYIYDWCKENATDDVKNKGDYEIVAKMLPEYVKQRNIPTVEITLKHIEDYNVRFAGDACSSEHTIQGIPARYVSKAGTYFRMIDNIWRPIFNDASDINLYVNYKYTRELIENIRVLQEYEGITADMMSKKNIANVVESIYGKRIADSVYYYITNPLVVYESEFLKMLRDYCCDFINEIVEITYEDMSLLLTDTKEIKGVPVNVIYRPGTYFMVAPGIWRMLVESIPVMFKYCVFLAEKSLLNTVDLEDDEDLDDSFISDDMLRPEAAYREFERIYGKAFTSRYNALAKQEESFDKVISVFNTHNATVSLHIDEPTFSIKVTGVTHLAMIPVEVMDKAGYYVLVAPNVWRRLVTDTVDMYNYAQYLGTKGLLNELGGHI